MKSFLPSTTKSLMAAPLLLVTFFLFTSPVLAQNQGLGKGFDIVTGIQGDSGVQEYDSLSGFIIAVLKVVSSLVAIIAVVAIIYAGVILLISVGDEKKMEEAKRIILYAVIGLILIGGAALIVNLVINQIIKK